MPWRPLSRPSPLTLPPPKGVIEHCRERDDCLPRMRRQFDQCRVRDDRAVSLLVVHLEEGRAAPTPMSVRQGAGDAATDPLDHAREAEQPVRGMPGPLRGEQEFDLLLGMSYRHADGSQGVHASAASPLDVDGDGSSGVHGAIGLLP